MIRAMPPIRFPPSENYQSIRGAALSSITANVESSRCDKKADNLRAADELRLENQTSNI
jgi:hypothetical protein